MPELMRGETVIAFAKYHYNDIVRILEARDLSLFCKQKREKRKKRFLAFGFGIQA